MNCAYCGFGFTGWDSVLMHVRDSHPDVNLRKPTSKERKQFIVQMVEEKLKGHLL